MNVLPIVISILLVLSIMTYTQIKQFLLREANQQEYVCYLQNLSRADINDTYRRQYQDSHGDGSETGKRGRVAAISTLNLQVFAQPDITEERERKRKAQEEIFKRLLTIIYENRRFFQDAENARPDLTDAITQSLMQELRFLESQGTPIRKKKELANLVFEDPFLSEIIAEMLKPVQVPTPFSGECTKKGGALRQFYPTILDFVSIERSNHKPYRVFLLKKELLLAIFQEEGIVDEIISKRSELYKNIREEKEFKKQVKQEASDEFERLFKGKLPRDLPEDMFNFEASGTNPNR